MNTIFVGGGQFRSRIFRKLKEWESCKRAMLVEIDPVTRNSHRWIEYESPKETAPDELPAILFKSATLRDNKLYACTATEVMIYDLPSFASRRIFPFLFSMTFITSIRLRREHCW